VCVLMGVCVCVRVCVRELLMHMIMLTGMHALVRVTACARTYRMRQSANICVHMYSRDVCNILQKFETHAQESHCLI
jgi:hypothetical protein